MKKCLSGIAILCLCALPGMAAQPLTSVQAIRALPKAVANKALPVDFEATVTYFHPDFRYLFVQDGEHAIFVYTPVGTVLSGGDRIRIQGVTHAEFRPDVVASSITVLRHGAMPTPMKATFEDLMSGKNDCRLVTFRGQVRAANLVLRPDVRSPVTFKEHVSYLDVLTDGGYVYVLVNTEDEKKLAELLDTEVEVTGATGGIYDGKWHQTSVLVRSFSFADVKVLKRATMSPWKLPLTAMDDVMEGYQVRDLTRRVHVRGTITFYEPGYDRLGSAAVLQSGDQSLWVDTLSDLPLRVGDLVDATGIPNVASGSPVLTHAEIEDTLQAAPVKPLYVTSEQLANADMAGKHHYDLVTIEGQVVTEARESLQDEYVLTHDGQMFSATIHHPLASVQLTAPAMREIPLGATVRVTGVCTLQDATLFTGEAPFEILMRTPEDITVVANPPVASVRNLMLLVGILAAVLVLMGARSWAIERKMRRQTAAAADLERRRSRILEEMNGARPLAEILEAIADMTSHALGGAACWCEVTDGARLGSYPAQTEGMRIVREPIPGRSGPPLGEIGAAFAAGTAAAGHEVETLQAGAGLATLAIETRRLYSDLRHRSEFDLLTDIHNRFSLEVHLENLIEQARENASIFGLVYIDLDRFKDINDQYGHNAGDLYLQEVAQRMKRQLRPGDLLARLGGDEFAVLVPVIRSRQDVQEIARRLERSFDEPFYLQGNSLKGSASVGIALYPEDGVTRDSLLSTADAAMYVSKHTRG